MLNIRYIGSMMLVALMLTTTIGISIYKHTCLVTGNEGISLFAIPSSVASETHACCAASKGDPNAPIAINDKKGCCEETASFHQLDIPQRTEEHSTYQQPLLPIVGVVSLPNIDLSYAETALVLPLYNNLPPPDNQRRMAQLQVYIL